VAELDQLAARVRREGRIISHAAPTALPVAAEKPGDAQWADRPSSTSGPSGASAIAAVSPSTEAGAAPAGHLEPSDDGAAKP
jgi:hypothetical protein